MTRKIDRLERAGEAHAIAARAAATGMSEAASQLRDEAVAHVEVANEHKTHASRAELVAWRLEEQAFKIGAVLK